MNLYGLQYNNYFNRQVKRKSSIVEYIQDARRISEPTPLINFNPNDGIDTSHIINWSEEWIPDYLLVVNDANEIVSRWFIIDMVRTCKNQYRVTLKRDVLAEKYNDIVAYPAFIEKGWVSDDNVLIYQSEPFTCNQIPQKLDLLTDDSHASWIVAYFNASEKQHLQGSITTLQEEYIDTGAATINDWLPVKDYFNDGYNRVTDVSFRVEVDQVGTPMEAGVKFDKNCDVLSRETYMGWDNSELEFTPPYANDLNTQTQNAIIANIDSNKENIVNAISTYKVPSMTWSSFSQYNGKVVKTADNQFYRISISSASNSTLESWLTVTSDPDNDDYTLYQAIKSGFQIGGQFKTGWSGNFTKAVRLWTSYTKYNISYTKITNDIETINYDFTNAHILSDQPYGILAFPYKLHDVDYIYDSGLGYIDDSLALEIIRDMSKDGIGSSHKLFDVQILPYCPIPQLTGTIVDMGNFKYIQYDFTDINTADDVNIVLKTPQHWGTFALIPTTNKFTLNISYEKEIENIKQENQTDYTVLYSPNGKSMYRFIPARNKGISYFNIDCTYQPYQPYIHVNPDFKGLYGQDFNNGEGLICREGFSISSIGSAWENFKLNNANYNEVFDRQIQNMDVTNEIALKEQAWSTFGGMGQGAAAGAVIGSVIPGIGTAVGAVGGAIASGLGGIGDRNIMKQRQAEARDYAIDMHVMNLQAVKSRPDTLTGIDAYTNNNMIWPYLIEFSCSDEEKYIFENMLEYDGMTVQAIGYIDNYLNPDLSKWTFIKAQIIRFEDFDEDAHYAQEIYNRLSEGVYM